jgi:hypothetical protein
VTVLSRRTFGKGLALMTTPRRVDQYYKPAAPALGAGTRSGNLRARLVVIFGTGANVGLFVYDPAPGAGNLIASIAPSQGTDPFGNAYAQGFATYGSNPGVFTQMIGAGLVFDSDATATRVTVPATIALADATTNAAQPALQLNGPGTGGIGDIMQVTLYGESEDNSSDALLEISGPKTFFTDLGGSPATAALVEINGTAAVAGAASALHVVAGTDAAPSTTAALEVHGSTDMLQRAAPGAPPAGYGSLYVDSSDGQLHYIDTSGVNHTIT